MDGGRTDVTRQTRQKTFPWNLSTLDNSTNLLLLISRTEDKQKSGNREVKLYDEEQFASYRKAQRAGETPKVQPLATLQVKYNGSYGSNLLISSEFVVLLMSLCVAYIAFQSKGQYK